MGTRLNELSVRIRRAAARWLFADRDNRMHYVAEEYGFGGRCADVIGYSRDREEIRGVYRKVLEPRWDGNGMQRVNRRVEDRVKKIPAEVRIVEVKISRGDFLGGIRKGQVANTGNGFGVFADFCYLATPGDLIRVDELPSGWGLLEYDERATGAGAVYIRHKPIRLAPTHPLTASEGLAHHLAQSALWRLYGYGRAAPEELAS
jgi:hypothetical protein